MLNIKKLYTVTLCLVCTGLVVLPTAQARVVDAANGYLFNVPDLQAGCTGFTNAAVTHLWDKYWATRRALCGRCRAVACCCSR